ncbi:MAG: DUF4097 family beta strand repeat-containing protein [Balneolaceae bacterium]|nr:DUF4097 family beta strand repeat-containing protein [Balneolaceae bacterium]
MKTSKTDLPESQKWSPVGKSNDLIVQKPHLAVKLTGMMLIITLFSAFIPFKIIIAQPHTEIITRTARFQNPMDSTNKLSLYNIHGSVAIEGYEGEEIQISVKQTIDTEDGDELEQALSELKIKVDQQEQQVIVYLDAPFIDIDTSGKNIGYRIDSYEDHYEFLHNFTIKVPRTTNVEASTINRGAVKLTDISAREISARNINGEIILDNISGDTKVRTVNGDITARYTANPTGNSDYKTVNGTIEVNYPQSLSADIRFKSMHGDLYTDFHNIHRLNQRVEESKESDGHSISYRVDKFSPIRIGKGGPQFNFEVLNGDVYIKQIKS